MGKGKGKGQQVVAQFPEKGTFTEEKALKKHYKGLTDEQVLEWVALEGLEFKACPEHPAIHRMRACMAILYYHFPKEPAKGKSESPYKKYETEELVQMAVDNSVAVKPTDDMKILRMRTIMALKEAKVLE